MDSIIEQLQKHKSYQVTELGAEGEKTNTISNYRAINSKTHEADVVKEIENADLVSLAPCGRAGIFYSGSTWLILSPR